MRRIACTGALALLVATGLARPVSAQDTEFAAIKSGIDRLHALPGEVQRARTVLGAYNFGPYSIHGSCDFQCWIGICLKTWNWTWNFPQFGGFKTALDQRLANVSQQAGGFDAAFAPTRQWLTVTLPQFSTYFDGAVKTLEADAAVIAKPGDAAAVAKANSDIVDTLSQISANLLNGSNQLRSSVSGLAQFNANFNNALSQVQSLSNVLDGAISGGRQDISKRMGDWPCGQGDATNGYNGITNTVRAQFDVVVQTAAATSATAQQTDKDVSLMLGTVLNLQTRYQGALTQIKAAQTTPQGAVQTLRVDVAAAAWHDLAQYAVQQLAGK